MNVSRKVAAVTVVLCVLTGGAHAQQKAPANVADDLLLLAGGQYGSPMRISAGLALFVPTGDRYRAITEGFLVEGSAGQGGARISAGLARFLEYLGLDGRAVLSRTWTSPRGAAAHSTYGGLEAGLTIAYVRVSAGVAHRIAGAAGPDATIFTWGAGLQIPFWR
jgi:hypothetical protein